uniref:Esterase/lipase n=1 Tax=Burkholderia sp. (strain CCGE1003) TaxID=640512 RepID=E1T9R1_BURSG
MTTDTLEHEIFPLTESDAAALPALHEAFRRFWNGPLAASSPRVAYDAFFSATLPRADVSFHPSTDAALPGWMCTPKDAIEDQAVLFLHGGAYVMGTAPAYRGFVSHVAACTQRATLILEYPLAPEIALPGALDLAVEAIERLRQQFEKVAVVGDSAGGGLTLATLAETSNASAAVVLSPWTDLTLSGSSVRDRASKDLLLTESALRDAARGYVGRAAADDPRGSPLLAASVSLPPLLIQVGSEEILYDDALRYAQKAHAGGNQVTLQEWTGMHHVFQMNVDRLAAAQQSLHLVGRFLDRQMGRSRK